MGQIVTIAGHDCVSLEMPLCCTGGIEIVPRDSANGCSMLGRTRIEALPRSSGLSR
jgi:hypothetical protein